jgi:polyketide synthase PksJ
LQLQVDVAASRIAGHLAGAAGVQPGCTVALLLGRGPLLVASLLGVLKAGAAYLTLDGSNKSHMQMMLEDACVQVRVLCTVRVNGAGQLAAECCRWLGSLHVVPVRYM